MPLPGILGGFESRQKHFFEIFGVKVQKEETGKYRKKSENFGEISEKVGKFRGNIGKCRKNRENSEKRNFGGDILSIFTDNRYFADISAEISEILFP